MTITRTRFDNGLTLLTQEQHAAPVVAIQVWVNVGSADESDVIAGIAHVHEHMLFKGTEKRGLGEIARSVEAAGGEINAWTSYDQTVYHVVLAAEEAATGLDILSDAIRHSAFDAGELSRELEVIVEEIRRAEDAPSRRIAKALFGLAYESHPYKRPVIGSEATVRSFTREKILDFFHTYYRPDNVTVVITGDVETAQITELARRYFGDWSVQGATKRPPRAVESDQNELRLHVMSEQVKESRMSIAWHVPGLSNSDIAAIDVLSVILGHGDSSRLYARTRRGETLVNDVYAYAYTPRDPGLFIVGAGLKAEMTENALASILACTYGMRDTLVDGEELEKAKIIVLSESAYQRETVQGEARKLGFFETVAGDYQFERAYDAALRKLTPEDVRNAARTYLTKAPSVVIQQPQTAAVLTLDAVRAITEKAAEKQVTKKAKFAPGDLGVTQVMLSNGCKLLVRDEDSPVVAIRALALGGVLWESANTSGVGNFLASVWGLATTKLGPQELATRVAGLGGSIAAFSGRNSIGLRADVIREKAEQGLSLFADALLTPELTSDDIERERAVIIERIKNREDNPAGFAFDAFAAMLFPDHPYGFRIAGTEESVARIDRSALHEHLNRLASPDKLIVAVTGGVAVERVLEALAPRLEAVPTGPSLPTPPVLSPRAPGENFKHIALDKKQSNVIIGGRGTTLSSPDRFALEVLTTVMSGQSGRLFMDLRDRQSLAYSVGCTAIEGLQNGHVLVHMGTSPEKVEQAVKGLMEHLRRIANEPITDAELMRSKRYLIGTHAIELQRTGSRATTMALSERFGLGYDAYTKYAESIRAISASDVLAVAKRYLNPADLVQVVVGPQ
ncbi:MAG: insulinase family protein [Clostridia bacterium]|nr:insulinase family protein [Deltaproteobacteria bacterium]